MEIFFALGVIAIVAFLGWLSRRLNILSKENTRGMSSYIYYFALPALFFPKIAQMDLANLNGEIVLGSLLPIFSILIFLLFLKITRIISKHTFILLALATSFGSNAFFGITFFETLAGADGLDFAILTSSILGPVGIFITIYIFEYASSRGEGWCFCGKIMRNPLIISILLGVVVSLLKIEGGFIFQGIETLGKTAGPLAEFALGTFIYDNFSFEKLRHSYAFALFRLIALPLVSFLIISTWLNVEGETGKFLILQGGIPSAISLGVFASRYNYKVDEISNLVVLTSLGSFVVLGIAYFLIN